MPIVPPSNPELVPELEGPFYHESQVRDPSTLCIMHHVVLTCIDVVGNIETFTMVSDAIDRLNCQYRSLSLMTMKRMMQKDKVI